MAVRYPNESADSRSALDRLLHKRDQLRRVAAPVARERRALPAGVTKVGSSPYDPLVTGHRAERSTMPRKIARNSSAELRQVAHQCLQRGRPNA